MVLFRYLMAIGVTIALVVAPVAAQIPAPTFDEAMQADLETFVRAAMAEYGVTGAAVAVVQDGGTSTYLGTFGTLGENDPQPVNSDTRFMIGSISKSFTTLLMAQLVDDGPVSWNTPVTDVLPEFALSDPDATAQVRVRDLFNMSTGLPRYDIPDLFASTPQDTFYWLSRTPLVAAPGEEYHYNNLIVAAGGWLAAVLTGTPFDGDLADAYASLMQSHVFDPIGMERATLDLKAAVADANHAVGYGYDSLDGAVAITEMPPVVLEHDVVSIAPAGAIWASITDMAKYVALQMNGGITASGERIVSEENLGLTHAGETPIDSGVRYGMGWAHSFWNFQLMISHNGSTVGYSSRISFLPESDLGIVVLNNLGPATNFNLTVQDFILEQAFGLEHTAAPVYSAAEAQMSEFLRGVGADWQPVDIDEVAAFTGEYEFGLQAAIEGDQFLVRTVIGDVPLLEIGDSGQYAMLSRLGLYRVTFTGQDDITMTLETMINFDDPPQAVSLRKVG
ncbi:MAG: serine hydrolase domain-containing protein [Anaerolineae bacterium]